MAEPKLVEGRVRPFEMPPEGAPAAGRRKVARRDTVAERERSDRIVARSLAAAGWLAAASACWAAGCALGDALPMLAAVVA